MPGLLQKRFLPGEGAYGVAATPSGAPLRRLPARQYHPSDRRSFPGVRRRATFAFVLPIRFRFTLRYRGPCIHRDISRLTTCSPPRITLALPYDPVPHVCYDVATRRFSWDRIDRTWPNRAGTVFPAASPVYFRYGFDSSYNCTLNLQCPGERKFRRE